MMITWSMFLTSETSWVLNKTKKMFHLFTLSKIRIKANLISWSDGALVVSGRYCNLKNGRRHWSRLSDGSRGVTVDAVWTGRECLKPTASVHVHVHAHVRVLCSRGMWFITETFLSVCQENWDWVLLNDDEFFCVGIKKKNQFWRKLDKIQPDRWWD